MFLKLDRINLLEKENVQLDMSKNWYEYEIVELLTVPSSWLGHRVIFRCGIVNIPNMFQLQKVYTRKVMTLIFPFEQCWVFQTANYEWQLGFSSFKFSFSSLKILQCTYIIKIH